MTLLLRCWIRLWFGCWVALALWPAPSRAGDEPLRVVFVGNSYTFGRVDPVMSYNAANVHDLTAPVPGSSRRDVRPRVSRAGGVARRRKRNGGLTGRMELLGRERQRDWHASSRALD